jgi:hypothetical protein
MKKDKHASYSYPSEFLRYDLLQRIKDAYVNLNLQSAYTRKEPLGELYLNAWQEYCQLRIMFQVNRGDMEFSCQNVWHNVL